MRESSEGEGNASYEEEASSRRNSNNLDIIKRNLLYDALSFNMREQ